MPDDTAQQNQQEVSVETALGKFKARGSDFIATATLVVSVCGFTIGWFLWESHRMEAKENGSQMVAVFKEFTSAQKEGVKEQRVLNCLISTDQKDRRRAYEECERIAR